MAFGKARKDEAPVVPATVGVSELAQALRDALGGPTIRKVPFGQHSVKTPFNPTGKRDRKVNYIVYQNGYRLNPRNLTDEEIELLNSGKLKPGLYLNKTLTVAFADDGGDPVVHINYKNKTADQRMALGSQLVGAGKTGFARLLRLVIVEKADQDKRAKEARRREIEEAMQPEVEDEDPLASIDGSDTEDDQPDTE